MLKRLFSGLALCLLLAGCVLQSPEPLFSESDGELALKSFGIEFESYNWTKGAWEREDEALTFVATGMHYVVASEKSETQILFVPLADSWWLMQMSEDLKPTYYVLAEAKGQELFVHVLACSDLQQNPAVKVAVRFEGDDCFTAAETGLDFFQTLVANAPAATLKLVAKP